MKKKQILKALSFLFSFILVVALLSTAVFAEANDQGKKPKTKYDENAINVDIRFSDVPNTYNLYGFKQGLLTLKNKTQDTLQGTIVLHFGYYLYYATGEMEDCSVLELPLELSGKTEKTISFITDFPSCNLCRIELIGENGTLLRSEDINLNAQHAEVLLGWMTEDTRETDILNRGSNSYIHCAALTPEFFPLDFELMRQYSLIIVNGADLSASSRYSQKQLSLLKKYIAEGGPVIVGTGSDTAVLQSFSEYFAGPVSAAVSVRKETFSQAVKYEQMQDFFNGADIYFNRLVFSNYYYSNNYYNYANEQELSDDEETALLQFSSVSLCSVNDANFDLCAAGGNAGASASSSAIALYKAKNANLYICNMNLGVKELLDSAQSNQFLVGLFGAAGINLSQSLTRDTLPLCDENEMETFGPGGLSPVIPILLLLLYCGCGILLPFILSKAKRKPKIAQIGIPSAAILFSLVVVLYGMLRHGVSPYSYSVSIAELESDGEATVLVSLKTAGPSSGKKTVSFERDNTVYLTTDLSIPNGSYHSLPIGYGARVSCIGTGSIQSSESVASWQNAYTYGYYRESYGGAFAIETTLDENSGLCKLTVRNNTGKDLENTAFAVFGSTFAIGDFPAGAAKTIEFPADGGYYYSDIDLKMLLKEFFYKPNGLSDTALSEDMLELSYNYYYYYSSYRDFLPLENLKKKSEPDALKALALYKAAWQNSVPESSVLILSIDPSAKLEPTVNGNSIQKSTNATLLTQTVRLPEVISDYALNHFDNSAVFFPAEGSECNIATWEDGYITLNPDSCAVFYSPLYTFLGKDMTLRFHAESDSNLAGAEIFVGALPQYNTHIDVFEQIKLDTNGMGEIPLYKLEEYYFEDYYEKYLYNNVYLSLPDRSLFLNSLPLNTELVLLVIHNTQSTPMIINGVSMEYVENSAADNRTDYPILTPETTQEPLPETPEIPTAN